jgi:hypothetical protein
MCGCLLLTFALINAMYKVIKNSSTFNNLPNIVLPVKQTLLPSVLMFCISVNSAVHHFSYLEGTYGDRFPLNTL